MSNKSDRQTILVTASAPINGEAVHHYLPVFPESFDGQKIAVLEGNLGLLQEMKDRCLETTVVKAKSRSPDVSPRTRRVMAAVLY